MGRGLGYSFFQLAFNKHPACVRIVPGAVSERDMAY